MPDTATLKFLSEIEGEVKGGFDAIYEDQLVYVTAVLDRTAVIERSINDRVLRSKGDILVVEEKLTVIPLMDWTKNRSREQTERATFFY